MSNKRIEQDIPITTVDRSRASHPHECIDNPTHLKLSLYYSTGGINYFTSRNEARGYYLSVSPVRIEKRDYGDTIATSLMSGVKDLVLVVLFTAASLLLVWLIVEMVQMTADDLRTRFNVLENLSGRLPPPGGIFRG